MPALREDTVAGLMHLMARWADPAVEARALAGFLGKQPRRDPAAAPMTAQPPLAAVIHGRNTLGDVHKFAQRMDALSVCSPYCSADLNYDVRFPLAPDGSGCDVLISDKRCSLLERDVQAQLAPHGKIVGTRYRKLDASRLLPGFTFDGAALARLNSPMSIAASYPSVMASMERILERLFPGIRCFYEEHAALPWSTPARREREAA